MKIIKRIWNRWKIIAHHIGIFQSRIILTFFYFVILLPIGIIFGFFKDVLEIKANHSTTWRNKEKQSVTMEQLKEQF